MMAMDGDTQRYRMEFYAQAFNLLNRTNFVNFVGNQRSDFFGSCHVGWSGATDRGRDQLRVLIVERRSDSGFPVARVSRVREVPRVTCSNPGNLGNPGNLSNSPCTSRAPRGVRLFARVVSPSLRENLDDDAAVLGATVALVVRRHRLVLAVADHVDLVQRHLVRFVEIALHGFRALETELLVVGLRTDVVRVALDLDEDVLRIGLEAGDHLVDLRLRLVGQHRSCRT